MEVHAPMRCRAGRPFTARRRKTEAAAASKATLTTTQLLTDLYSLPSSDFHDLTSGFNGYSAKAGYDLVTDATLGRGTSASVANGFGPDSPYNADLPYNLKQTALFGEMSYDITNQLTGTA